MRNAETIATIVMLAFFTSFADVATGEFAENRDVRTCRGPAWYYNYDHYRNIPLKTLHDTRQEELHSKQRWRFFWESKIKPKLLPTEYIRVEKSGNEIFIDEGFTHSRLKKDAHTDIYYHFAGAYWTRGEVSNIHWEVYSHLPGFGLSDGNRNVAKRVELYPKHKPEATIFASVKKIGSKRKRVIRRKLCGDYYRYLSEEPMYFLHGKEIEFSPTKHLRKRAKREQGKELTSPGLKKIEQIRELQNEGQKFMARNKYREAIKCFEQARQKSPDHSVTYYQLGLCYERIGNTKGALKNYNKYLELIEGEPWKEDMRSRVRQSVARLESLEQKRYAKVANREKPSEQERQKLLREKGLGKESEDVLQSDKFQELVPLEKFSMLLKDDFEHTPKRIRILLGLLVGIIIFLILCLLGRRSIREEQQEEMEVEE